MTLPASGTISISSLRTEFYAGGGVTDLSNYEKIVFNRTGFQAVSMSEFFSKGGELAYSTNILSGAVVTLNQFGWTSFQWVSNAGGSTRRLFCTTSSGGRFPATVSIDGHLGWTARTAWAFAGGATWAADFGTGALSNVTATLRVRWGGTA